MKVRVVLSSLLAVLALNAVVASAAQASAEGPFFKDGAARLLEGESKEVKVKAAQGIELGVSALGIKISCNKAGVASGAKLLGSTGANSATGEATLELSECIISGDGSNCTIEGAAFKTEPLKLELAYPGDARSGDMEVVIKSAGKSGKFADAKIAGSGCFWNEMPIYGTLVGQVESKGNPVVVGSEPAAAKTLQIHFNNEHKTAWIEKSGSLKSAEVESFQTNGNVLNYTQGLLEAELASGAEWGVFS